MAPSIVRLGAAALACATSTLALEAYQLKEQYTPDNFFEKFNFFSSRDPNQGFVKYRNKKDADDLGLITRGEDDVTIRVDSTKIEQDGRNSVRLESANTYNSGLFIADFAHFPKQACGAWPAFWMVGPKWPDHGEIDIYEGWNLAQKNKVVLHIDHPDNVGVCVLNPLEFTSEVKTPDCWTAHPGQPGNAGCAVDEPTGLFGNPDGGVFAFEWKEDSVKVWSWQHGSVPPSVRSANPDPSEFGRPSFAAGGNTCDVKRAFKNMRMVLNINFCGDAAGNTWVDGCQAATGAEMCHHYVRDNPAAYKDTFWKVRGINVYQLEEKKTTPTSTSTSTTSTSTTSSASTSTSTSTEEERRTSTESTSTSTTSTSTTSTSTESTSTSSTETSTETSTQATTTSTTEVDDKTTTTSEAASSTTSSEGSIEPSTTVTDDKTTTSTTADPATSTSTDDEDEDEDDTCEDDETNPSVTESATTTDSVDATATTTDSVDATATSTDSVDATVTSTDSDSVTSTNSFPDSSATASTTSFTTSTIYTTITSTITSCEAEVTKCPVRTVTSVISIGTTVCPVTDDVTATATATSSETEDVQPSATATASATLPDGWTTSTIYTTSTYTVTSCPLSVSTNCPSHETSTLIPIGTTICPVASDAVTTLRTSTTVSLTTTVVVPRPTPSDDGDVDTPGGGDDSDDDNEGGDDGETGDDEDGETGEGDEGEGPEGSYIPSPSVAPSVTDGAGPEPSFGVPPVEIVTSKASAVEPSASATASRPPVVVSGAGKVVGGWVAVVLGAFVALVM